MTHSCAPERTKLACATGVLLGLLANLGCHSGQPEDSATEPATGRPPVLYANPLHESPVRGMTGDLLIIPGSGFDPMGTTTVVYLALSTFAPGAPLTHPTHIPTTNTATTGTFRTLAVDANSVKASIPLPPHASQELRDEPYVLWAVNANGWSNAALINDPRPMWLSPASVVESGAHPGLPRQLKIVGRNLEGVSSAAGRVRLTNGSDVRMLQPDAPTSAVAARYSAVVTLPLSTPQLALGNYTVEVTRDGVRWTMIDQPLVVKHDPTTPPRFRVSDQAAKCNATCSPNDLVDDTCCVVGAIMDAASAGGGDVIFPRCPPGQKSCRGWRIDSCASTIEIDPSQDYCYQPYGTAGILVPHNVNLKGEPVLTQQGWQRSVISVTSSWDHFLGGPPTYSTNRLFNVQGDNVISGLEFRVGYDTPGMATPATIALSVHGSGVTITNNLFANPYTAIEADRHNPSDTMPEPTTDPCVPPNGIADLTITANELAGYHESLNLVSRICDSAITGNSFYPGAYEAYAAGTVGLGILGATRVDLSANTMDGTVHAFEGTSHPGFRAGMFFPQTWAHEMMLVAQNKIYCTGTKPQPADGEAFSLDGNTDLDGFDAGKPVLSASPTSVVVTQQDGDVLGKIRAAGQTNVIGLRDPQEFVGVWLQVTAGPGLGQTRKIAAVTASATSPTVSFTVTPGFDVTPTTQSRIMVTNQAWQVFIVDNIIDNRIAPNANHGGCTQVAVGLQGSSGLIGLAGPSADLAVESNQLLATNGIYVATQHNVWTDPVNPSQCNVGEGKFGHYFDEIRDNKIAGAPQLSSATPGIGGSGIHMFSMITAGVEPTTCYYRDPGANPDAGPYPHFPPARPDPAVAVPDTLVYGLAISHNTLTDAEGRTDSSNVGGAIRMQTEDLTSPSPGFVDTLIFANSLTSTTANDQNYGIMNGDPIVSHFGTNYPVGSVICGNTVSGFPAGDVSDHGHETVVGSAPCTGR